MAKVNLLKKAGLSLNGAKPNLLRKAKPPADPLASVVYTDELQEDTKREFSAIDLAFKAQAKLEKEKHRNVLDTEYWNAICWESREQKDAFLRELRNLGLTDSGDKYINGVELARVLGIQVERDAPPHRERGIDPKLAEIAMSQEVTG